MELFGIETYYQYHTDFLIAEGLEANKESNAETRFHRLLQVQLKILNLVNELKSPPFPSCYNNLVGLKNKIAGQLQKLEPSVPKTKIQSNSAP